ncbi:hypothetical protein FBQ81_02790 [Chloroflexi bacterium CFX6]|nr:hypothetical protein [Chloroflexi bacterium CFX6]
MQNPQPDLQLLRMVSDRLERISADSIWAHRASGVRGSLLRILDEARGESPPDPGAIASVLAAAFRILEGAAKRS